MHPFGLAELVEDLLVLDLEPNLLPAVALLDRWIQARESVHELQLQLAFGLVQLALSLLLALLGAIEQLVVHHAHVARVQFARAIGVLLEQLEEVVEAGLAVDGELSLLQDRFDRLLVLFVASLQVVHVELEQIERCGAGEVGDHQVEARVGADLLVEIAPFAHAGQLALLV